MKNKPPPDPGNGKQPTEKTSSTPTSKPFVYKKGDSPTSVETALEQFSLADIHRHTADVSAAAAKVRREESRATTTTQREDELAIIDHRTKLQEAASALAAAEAKTRERKLDIEPSTVKHDESGASLVKWTVRLLDGFGNPVAGYLHVVASHKCTIRVLNATPTHNEETLEGELFNFEITKQITTWEVRNSQRTKLSFDFFLDGVRLKLANSVAVPAARHIPKTPPEGTSAWKRFIWGFTKRGG